MFSFAFRKRRGFSLLVLLIFMSASLFSIFFLAEHGDHDCAELHCATCAQIHAVTSLLKLLGTAGIALLLFALRQNARFVAFPRHRERLHPALQPVFLKVRLNH